MKRAKLDTRKGIRKHGETRYGATPRACCASWLGAGAIAHAEDDAEGAPDYGPGSAGDARLSSSADKIIHGEDDARSEPCIAYV